MLFKVLIQLSLLPVFFSPKPQFCSFFFLLFECCCILRSCYNFGDFHTNPCAIQSFSLFNCMQVFFLLWLFAFLFSCFFPIAFFVFSLSMVIHILSFGIFYVLSSRIWLFDFFFFLVATFFSPDQCFRFDRRCSPQWQNFWYAPHFFSHRSSPLVLQSYTSFYVLFLMFDTN